MDRFGKIKMALKISLRFYMVSILIFMVSSLRTATGGVVKGRVTDQSGDALPGANVYIPGTLIGTSTNREGYFQIDHIPAGSYLLKVEFIGYQSRSKAFRIGDQDTVEIKFVLSVQPVAGSGILVTTSRWGEITEQLSHLPVKTIRRLPVRVTGELLRTIPGVDAVRRGPVGLDPVVRGLRETEVGTYVDGTRYFPGGAARMDSPLSHFDPSAIYRLRVIKGPYALTLGAGNLSAIQAESPPLPWEQSGEIHGQLSAGHYSNLNAPETILSVQGNLDRVAFWVHGNWRKSSDYHSGNGEIVPADFKSREGRGKLGIKISSKSTLVFSGGYQYQNDIDYPGRLLNARFFKVYNANIRYRFEQSSGLVQTLEVLGYTNDVDHEMDNDNKPTAEPNPNRKPPFPLLVEVKTGSHVDGGRIALELKPSDRVTLKLGGDIYSANRNARRNISRRDNGMVLLKNDLVWPDVTITDGGLFTQFEHPLTPAIRVVGSARIDFVHANADTASQFFLENVSGELSQDETHLSGALMIESAVNRHWVVALGAGSAVRTADASERYSERFPASKAQTSAEFMGNPNIQPERSNQADVWIEATYPHLSLQVNAFVRRIENYITLQPTNFPKKLPLSPDVVFQYVNGEADFWGTETAIQYQLNPLVTLHGSFEYLWGQDNTLDEPALGIAPVRSNIGVKFNTKGERLGLDATVHLVGDQNRVARSRGEIPTKGYVTTDFRGFLRPRKNFEINFGVINATNTQYVNHLNAKNPFTGKPVPEPGRQFFARLSLIF